MATWRQGEFGKRPVRVANCSGYCGDPAEKMYEQATLGEVDFITGDYLAEVNIARNSEAYEAGEHPGYEATAWEGLKQTIEVLDQKKIKVAINGGALNPSGLAKKVHALIQEKKLDLQVAFVSGDDIRAHIGTTLPKTTEAIWPHLDFVHANTKDIISYVKGTDTVPIVSANAYLGARGIVEAFKQGADIVICGRVSDASPVIAAAWYWHSWTAKDYDKLAGGLIAGHLIECSAYVTGANFSGFTKYDRELLIDPGFPVAEIDAHGSCTITKTPGTKGTVTVDTVRSQLLYELQGNIYLHSDVKAVLDGVRVTQIAQDRVRVTGIQGRPPTATTKVAIYYKGGYEAQILVNANGYAYAEKCDLFERQLRYFLGDQNLKNLSVFEVQRIGVPAENASSQNSSTMYIRVFISAKKAEYVMAVTQALSKISLKHFSGFHSSLDFRTAVPRPFLTYYPALWPQAALDERVHFLVPEGEKVFSAGHPPSYEDLGRRENYETASPVSFSGHYRSVRLGDLALARSGDKGSNVNIGIFVHSEKEWSWLRSYLTRFRMQTLIGDDWRDFYIERVEFPHIYAVHFVIYGILGQGVSSSSRLDGLGKGFADYIRDKIVDVPEEILECK